jgi:pyroglutamyl-peptidase
MLRNSICPAAPPVRVLVTGFGPFPGVPVNASATVAEALMRTAPIAGVNLFAEVIPVDWDHAAEVSREAIAKHRPHAILHFGVAKRAAKFEVETRALNMSTAREDNNGRKRGARCLEAGGPLVRESTLPAGLLLRALRQSGYPAVLSRNAGRYLCNAILYTSLGAASGNGGPLVAFVHLPAFGVEGNVSPLFTLDDAVDGARILVRASAAAVLRTRRLESAPMQRRRERGPESFHGVRRNGGRVLWRERGPR